jgi:hypothetical protein
MVSRKKEIKERKNELQKYTNLTKCTVPEKDHRNLEIGGIKVCLKMESS